MCLTIKTWQIYCFINGDGNEQNLTIAKKTDIRLSVFFAIVDLEKNGGAMAKKSEVIGGIWQIVRKIMP